MDKSPAVLNNSVLIFLKQHILKNLHISLQSNYNQVCAVWKQPANLHRAPSVRGWSKVPPQLKREHLQPPIFPAKSWLSCHRAEGGRPQLLAQRLKTQSQQAKFLTVKENACVLFTLSHDAIVITGALLLQLARKWLEHPCGTIVTHVHTQRELTNSTAYLFRNGGQIFPSCHRHDGTMRGLAQKGNTWRNKAKVRLQSCNSITQS